MTGSKGSTPEKPPSEEPCRNCGDPTPGAYCPSCGQAKRDVAVSVGTLLGQVLEEQLFLDRTLPRTLFGLLFRPGFLTAEYTRGHIVRYAPPLRLYLVSSVLFFVLIGLFGLGSAGDTSGESPPEVPGVIADSLVAVSLRTGSDSLTIAEALATLDSLQELDSIRVATAQGGLQPWARTLDLEVGDEELSARVRRRALERFGRLPIREALRAFFIEYLSYVPHTMFVLLPVFALVLKVLYIRRDRFYVEHFVFALHVHAFLFLVFVLMLAVPWTPLRLALVGWTFVYVWLAMKRVYGQGVVRTSLKYALFGGVYGFLLVNGLLATVVVTLLLL